MGDQEHQQPENRELISPHPRELTLDRSPSEQTRMAEFLPPASTQDLPMESPTTGNQVDLNHQDPPDHHDLVGGSPRQGGWGQIQVLRADDGAFGSNDDLVVRYLEDDQEADVDGVGRLINDRCNKIELHWGQNPLIC